MRSRCSYVLVSALNRVGAYAPAADELSLSSWHARADSIRRNVGKLSTYGESTGLSRIGQNARGSPLQTSALLLGLSWTRSGATDQPPTRPSSLNEIAHILKSRTRRSEGHVRGWSSFSVAQFKTSRCHWLAA